MTRILFYLVLLFGTLLHAPAVLAQGELDTVSHRAIDSRHGAGRQIQLPAGLPVQFQDADLLSELIRFVQDLKPGSDPFKQYAKLAELRKRLQRPADQPMEPSESPKPVPNENTPPEKEPPEDPNNVLSNPPVKPTPNIVNDPDTVDTNDVISDVLERLRGEDKPKNELVEAILSGPTPTATELEDIVNNLKGATDSSPSPLAERLDRLKKNSIPGGSENEVNDAPTEAEKRVIKEWENLRDVFIRRTNFLQAKNVTSEEDRQTSNTPQVVESNNTSTPELPHGPHQVANAASQRNPRPRRPTKSDSSSIEPSRRIMESLMEAMDSTGVDLLDAVRDPKRRQEWGWINDARRKTTRTFKPYKKYFSSNMPRMSWDSHMPRRQAPEISMPSVDASAASDVVPFLGLLAIGGVLGMVAWRRFLVFPEIDDPDERIPAPMPISNVVDRRSFVRACHRLAVRRLGWRSRFWNHARMFRSLANAIPHDVDDVRVDDVRRLARVYEYARYAPSDFALNQSQLARIRNILSALEVDETVPE